MNGFTIGPAFACVCCCCKLSLNCRSVKYGLAAAIEGAAGCCTGEAAETAGPAGADWKAIASDGLTDETAEHRKEHERLYPHLPTLSLASVLSRRAARRGWERRRAADRRRATREEPDNPLQTKGEAVHHTGSEDPSKN
jgi:hypothetical protein